MTDKERPFAGFQIPPQILADELRMMAVEEVYRGHVLDLPPLVKNLLELTADWIEKTQHGYGGMD